MKLNLNIFKALSTIKELEGEKAQLLERLVKAEEDLSQSQETIAEFMAKQESFDTAIEAAKADADASIEKVKEEYQNKVNELEVKVVEAKASANDEAAQVLASIGVEEDNIPTSIEDTNGNVLEQFNSLEGKEQTAFYLANKEEILRATGLIKH